ncbi:hypothetical protein M9458_049018, partial [Cirrhinus mrigala]
PAIYKVIDYRSDRAEDHPGARVREPATVLAMGESAMGSESVEGSSTHCTVAEGEPSSVDYASVCPNLSACITTTMEVVPLLLVLPVLGVALWCVWAAHTIPRPPEHPELPPSLPASALVLTIASAVPWQPLRSPSAHHLCGGIAAG